MGKIARKRVKGMKFLHELPYSESALMRLGYELCLKRGGKDLKYTYRKQVRIIRKDIVLSIYLPSEGCFFFDNQDDTTVIHPTDAEMTQIYNVMSGEEFIPDPQIEELINSLLWQ